MLEKYLIVEGYYDFLFYTSLFESLSGDHHWLGDGVYFFIESIYSKCSINDAECWAKLNAYDKVTRNYKYIDYVVIENEIKGGLNIWDLASPDGAEIFMAVKEKIIDKIKEAKKTIKKGPLDGVVINFAIAEIPDISFNAVKNHLFIQLTVNERLNRIGYSQPNCTVLAVRDASVISVGIPIKEGVVT